MPYANDYTLLQWVDEQLPKNATVYTSSRTHAFAPRPFIAHDVSWFSGQAGDLSEVERAKFLKRLFIDHEVEYITLGRTADRPPYTYYGACVGEPIAQKNGFPVARRNPFNIVDTPRFFVIVPIDAQCLIELVLE